MSGIDVPAPSEREAPQFFQGELPLKPIGFIRTRDGLAYAPLMMLYATQGEAENGAPMAAMFSEDQVRWMLARAALSVPCRLDTDQASRLSDHAAPAPSSAGSSKPLGMNARIPSGIYALRLTARPDEGFMVTSPDVEGLCLWHMDLPTVLADIPASIATLYRLAPKQVRPMPLEEEASAAGAAPEAQPTQDGTTSKPAA